jgi:hypothetical protein
MVEVCKVAVIKNANTTMQAGSTPKAKRAEFFMNILSN